MVVAQTAIQVGLSLGPGLWVMIHELGHLPRFRGARLADYKALGHISFYMALIQISVVLADKIDTTILGFMLKPDPGRPTPVYDVVSKPFLQLRQTGWMLAYMVMPAVASLAAARDLSGLERVKYDGTRLHVGALLPIGLLGWIYAGPFLSLWIGNRLGYDAEGVAYLMRLFLTAAIPLVLSVPVQMAIGLNKIEVIALAALGGSLINLPVSCYLTYRHRRGRRDLGHRADDVLLEPAGARPLRLPRARDRPANVSETNLEPAPGRRDCACRGVVAVATDDTGQLPGR